MLRAVAIGLALPLFPAELSFGAPPCGEAFALVSEAEIMGRRYAELGDAIHLELSQNLFELQQKSTPEFVSAWNHGLLSALEESKDSLVASSKPQGLTPEEIKALAWKLKNHPLAAPSYILRKKYDKTNKGIGFCFGRALIVQLEAARMGVPKKNMRKIWVVGPMKKRDLDWQHHVATMIKGDDGKWYVFDTFTAETLPVNKWFEEIQNFFNSDKLQLFTTDSKRFTPFDDRPLLPSSVKDPFYENYFRDLLERSRAASKEIMRQRKAARGCQAEKPPITLWGCLKEIFLPWGSTHHEP